MGKRYYCDYCDRSFKDDVEARKKHLSSLQHMKNRANHYSIFKDAFWKRGCKIITGQESQHFLSFSIHYFDHKDPETILKEEYKKTPCKRHMSFGDCAFGFGCRFSHYTPYMIWTLERLVATRNSKESLPPKGGWPNPEDIIKEYFENVTDSSDIEEFNYPVWSISSQLVDYPNLPPSLWPSTPENAVNSSLSKWG